VVSDDTQMTLFTAEGLHRALWAEKGARVEAVVGDIRAAYLDWLLTQGSSWSGWQPRGRLVRLPATRPRRAPGNTCMSALAAGVLGTTTAGINNSKGCGGATAATVRLRVDGVALREAAKQAVGLAERQRRNHDGAAEGARIGADLFTIARRVHSPFGPGIGR
jgi:ADP-ribosyl-[dinitrogen reductase] hydrolase